MFQKAFSIAISIQSRKDRFFWPGNCVARTAWSFSRILQSWAWCSHVLDAVMCLMQSCAWYTYVVMCMCELHQLLRVCRSSCCWCPRGRRRRFFPCFFCFSLVPPRCPATTLIFFHDFLLFLTPHHIAPRGSWKGNEKKKISRRMHTIQWLHRLVCLTHRRGKSGPPARRIQKSRIFMFFHGF